MGVISSGRGVVNNFVKLKEAKEEYLEATTSKKKETAQKKIQSSREQIRTNALTGVVAAATFSYGLYTSLSRFGQRGKDIQDINNIQDKLITQSLNIGLAFAINPAMGAYQLLSTGISELVSVIKQNAQYDYDRKVEQDQKQVLKERVGVAAWNSSRRGAI
jgi:hypothetical protein